MEDGLFDWIIELRGCNLHVSGEMMRQQAKKLSKTVYFKASRGWLDGFMKRKNFLFDVKLLFAKLLQPIAFQN